MPDTVRRDVVVFLEENIPPGVSVDRIDGETDLIGSGIIDSFGVVGFIEFLEERFGMVVSDDDIDPDNFRTVTRIVEYATADTRQDR